MAFAKCPVFIRRRTIIIYLQADNFSAVLETETGIAKTPYNPFHNSTALITSEGDFYGATMIGPGDRDPAIYRSKGTKSKELRTIQSNSKWLNGKTKVLIAIITVVDFIPIGTFYMSAVTVTFYLELLVLLTTKVYITLIAHYWIQKF